MMRLLQAAFPPIFEDNQSDEVLRRRIFLLAASMIGVLTFPGLIFIEGGLARPLSYFLEAGLVLFVATFFLARRGIAERLLSRLILAYLCALMLYTLSLDRGSYELYYLLLIPLIATFAFGMREGALWGTSFFVVTLASAYLLGPLESLEYAVVHLSVAYLVLFVFTLCYEAVRKRSHRLAELRLAARQEQNKEILKTQEERDRLQDRVVNYARLASDWFYELDENLTLRYISNRFEQLSGMPSEEIIGMNIMEIIDEYQDCDRETHKARLLAHEPFRDFRYRVNLPNGNELYVLTRGEPLFGNDGTFKGYMGSSSDVTDYELFQQEIRRQDRTLQHVQRLDAIGQLTSGIAHDFNNMLTVILGNLELLRLDVSDKLKEPIDAITSASRQAADLTAKLLTLSRDQPDSTGPVDIPEVMNEMTHLLLRSLGESIVLVMRVDDEVGECFTDRSQLESALLNLSINARDAMDGKGKLEIHVKEVTYDHKRCVRFDVIDQGKGIPEQMIERIVEPFFTTKPLGSGTGLGLSMVHGFAKQTGGDLLIDSEIDVGTTISLLIPTTPETGTTAEVIQMEPEVSEQDQLRILLVEDEEQVRIIVSRMLEIMGHDCDIAIDGDDALSQLNDTTYQLVLSDVMLGSGMSGLELGEEIRRREPATRVMLMSGYPEQILGDEKSENYDILKKPFGFNELSSRLAG